MFYKYWNSPAKIKARQKNIESYRSMTGNHSIPEGKTYVTLCNLQPPNEEGCELNQVFEAGLITAKKQFVGVDIKRDVINKNKRWHPECTWYCQNWRDAMRDNDFNPAMVCLDVGNTFADGQRAMNLLVPTMYLCPKETVIVINLIAKHAKDYQHKNIDTNALVDQLAYNVPEEELSLWEPEVKPFCYAYNGVGMISYVFYKGRSDE